MYIFTIVPLLNVILSCFKMLPLNIALTIVSTLFGLGDSILLSSDAVRHLMLSSKLVSLGTSYLLKYFFIG